MRRLFILTGREIMAFAWSPVTWIIMGLAWLAYGIIYHESIIPQSGGDLLGMIWQGTFWAARIQMLFIPLLTMRLLCEEKRSGTFEMLVTTPVRDHEIVLGKFAAAMVVNCFMWLVIPLYAWIMKLGGGRPDIGPVWTSYLSVIGIGALFISLGLLASATTRHLLLAGFLGILLILTLSYLPLAANALPETWSTLRDIFAIGNLQLQTEESARGIFDLVSVTYQVAFTGLFLLFTIRILEVRKWA